MIVAAFISAVRIEKNVFEHVILNPLNLSHHHGNMERSILKFDSENCDPLINKKSYQVLRENLFLFLSNAGKTDREGGRG